MGLLELIIVLAIIGFVVYMILHYVPMPEPFKIGIIVLCCIVAVLFVVRALGIDVALPRVR